MQRLIIILAVLAVIVAGAYSALTYATSPEVQTRIAIREQVPEVIEDIARGKLAASVTDKRKLADATLGTPIPYGYLSDKFDDSSPLWPQIKTEYNPLALETPLLVNGKSVLLFQTKMEKGRWIYRWQSRDYSKEVDQALREFSDKLGRPLKNPKIVRSFQHQWMIVRSAGSEYGLEFAGFGERDGRVYEGAALAKQIARQRKECIADSAAFEKVVRTNKALYEKGLMSSDYIPHGMHCSPQDSNHGIAPDFGATTERLIRFLNSFTTNRNRAVVPSTTTLPPNHRRSN